MAKEALRAEEKAMLLDPGRRQYYRGQGWEFDTQNDTKEVSSPPKGEDAEPPQHRIPQLKLPNTKEK